MLQIFLTHLSQVCAGEKAEFKIKIVSKREDVCWSIGIVRDTTTPGEAWSSMGYKDKVFYMNTAKSNIFNGPFPQVWS
jgi:hypothetical protein